MKLTREAIKEQVRTVIRKKLQEKFDYSNDLVPDDVVGYATKIDKFLMKTAEELLKLHKEGQEMMRPDNTNNDLTREIRVRNEFLLKRLGFVKTLASSIMHRLSSEAIDS